MLPPKDNKTASHHNPQPRRESEMTANNLKKHLLFHVINTAQTIMRNLESLFCTSEPNLLNDKKSEKEVLPYSHKSNMAAQIIAQ